MSLVSGRQYLKVTSIFNDWDPIQEPGPHHRYLTEPKIPASWRRRRRGTWCHSRGANYYVGRVGPSFLDYWCLWWCPWIITHRKVLFCVKLLMCPFRVHILFYQIFLTLSKILFFCRKEKKMGDFYIIIYILIYYFLWGEKRQSQ